MDRRKKRTRNAIFISFIELLSKKNYNNISVQDIIARADIGRTTFYSHFETKDFLLKELCEELFNHIMYKAAKLPDSSSKCSCSCPNDAIFLHLLKHLKENRMNIIGLLSSENNDIFLNYFKVNLKKLVVASYKPSGLLTHPKLSENFLTNHIAATFVETVHWWISNNLTETPEEMSEMFLALIDPILKKV